MKRFFLALTLFFGLLYPILPASADSLIVQADHLTGYNRNLFKLWIDSDKDGCDTRAEVLIEEAVIKPKIGKKCALTGGKWLSPYDGKSTSKATDLDIDHVVPLEEAWRSGAWAWTSSQRQAYANDLSDVRALVAVSLGQKKSKGDKDVAQWLPIKGVCVYITAWLAVKYRYSLTVDSAESQVLNSYSTSCGLTNINVVTLPAYQKYSPSVTPKPTPTPTPSPSNSPCKTTLSAPVITVIPAALGYLVSFNQAENPNFGYVQIFEVISSDDMAPRSGFQEVWVTSSNPIQVTVGLKIDKRWVIARLLDKNCGVTGFSNAVSVKPFDPVADAVDFTPPDEVTITSAQWVGDEIQIAYTVPTNGGSEFQMFLTNGSNTRFLSEYPSGAGTSQIARISVVQLEAIFGVDYPISFTGLFKSVDKAKNISAGTQFSIAAKANNLAGVVPVVTPTPTVAPIKYANCTLAKAAGVAPIRKDTNPALYEVNAGLDRDKDGVACDN